MKITDEELETIQQMNTEYSQLKNSIAEIELQKYATLNAIEALREKFSNHERLLVSKYGIDSVINLKTGDITKKEKE